MQYSIFFVDKDNESVYIAGILLDGYRYASRSTTNDRDKLSEVVLTRLGWNIIKVWSIEWWHNEEKQIEYILSQLEALKKIRKGNRSENEQTNMKENNQKSIQERINSHISNENIEEKKLDFFEPVILEKVILPNEFFYTFEGLPTIQQQIEEVIEKEAPVSFSRLTKLIIEAWGFSRSGAKIETVIQNSLSSLMLYESSEEKDTFLWKDKHQYENFKTFRVIDDYRRPLEDISKVEFANGINNIMKPAFRLPISDLIREVSKQLGYNRSTNKTEKYVQEAIDFNKEKDLLVEGEDGFIEIKM